MKLVTEQVKGNVYMFNVTLSDGSELRFMEQKMFNDGSKKALLEVMVVSPGMESALDVRPKANNVVHLIPSNIWYQDRKKK